MLGRHYGLDDFVREQGTFVFAAERGASSGALVRLAPGTARQSRQHTRQDLMCPVPGCTAPDITTVDRSATGHRDGYRHLIRGSGDHSGEGFHHLLAKAAVLHWARAHPAVLHAATEVGIGDRVADVLIEGVGGFVIAIEVQYAALDVNSWRARDSSYRDLGITPVWLWGHVGHHGPRGSGQTPARAVHRELLRTCNPLLWVNPHDETLAWAAGTDGSFPEPNAEVVSPELVALDSTLLVTSDGIYPADWLAAKEAWRIAQEEKTRAAARLAEFEEAQRRRRREEAEVARRRREAVVRRTRFGPDPICDVCKFPVRPADAQVGRRHEVCSYGLPW